MALIKYGQLIAEARGALAGTVFSRNTYGAYMRSKVSPVNPNTTAQQGVRQFLTTVAQSWAGLSDNERLGWNTAAVNFSRTNIFGDSVPLTGFGLYTRLNRNLQEIGEALITAAPFIETITGIESLTLTATAATLSLAFAPDPVPAGHTWILYATPTMNAGKKFVKSEFRKIATIPAAQVSPFDLFAAWQTVFGGSPISGGRIFVKVVPVLISNGQRGTELQASDIVA